MNTETGVVGQQDTGGDLALAINPRGSNNNVLERQLARQEASSRPSGNFNSGGFRSVQVDFNRLPLELRNNNRLISK